MVVTLAPSPHTPCPYPAGARAGTATEAREARRDVIGLDTGLARGREGGLCTAASPTRQTLLLAGVAGIRTLADVLVALPGIRGLAPRQCQDMMSAVRTAARVLGCHTRRTNG